MAITLTLNDEIDISRGNLIVKENEIEPRFNDSFEAFIVWMDEEAYKNREYYIKLYTKETNAVISKILFKKDVNTWEKLEAKILELNDIARVQIDLTEKVAFDFYEDNKSTGAFILIDKITNNTVAAGMIVGESTKINAESFEYYKWCELKQKISKKTPLRFKEREIFFIHMGKNIGYEQNGKGSEFLRPVLVYKKFGNETFLGIPLTNSMKEGMFYTKVKFKNRTNTALLSQIRLFDAKRLKYFVCRLPQNEFNKIKEDLNRLINPQKRERT
jgi:mRNA-degrading endonuclease toxin of MazEF toxin-antitoxin module